jgi:hypothetical protein
MLQGGSNERNKSQEIETQAQTVLTVNSGSEPDYQIYIPLGWALGEGNI